MEDGAVDTEGREEGPRDDEGAMEVDVAVPATEAVVVEDEEETAR